MFYVVGTPLVSYETVFLLLLHKFCRTHHDLADPYNVAVSKLMSDLMTSFELYEGF